MWKRNGGCPQPRQARRNFHPPPEKQLININNCRSGWELVWLRGGAVSPSSGRGPRARRRGAGEEGGRSWAGPGRARRCRLCAAAPPGTCLRAHPSPGALRRFSPLCCSRVGLRQRRCVVFSTIAASHRGSWVSAVIPPSPAIRKLISHFCLVSVTTSWVRESEIDERIGSLCYSGFSKGSDVALF